MLPDLWSWLRYLPALFVGPIIGGLLATVFGYELGGLIYSALFAIILVGAFAFVIKKMGF